VRITGEVEDIHVLISKGRGYTCGIMSLSFINSEPIQHSSVSTAGGSGSMPSPAAPARSLSLSKKKKKNFNTPPVIGGQPCNFFQAQAEREMTYHRE